MPLTETLSQLLLQPVSNGPLVSFRVLLGLLLCIFGRVHYHDYMRCYADNSLRVGYELTRFIKPLSPRGYQWLFSVKIALAFVFATGFGVHWTAAALFVMHGYILLVDRTHYNNHEYFITLLLGLYIFIDSTGLHAVPRWQLLAIQLQVAIVYWFGGIAKLNYDWLVRNEPFGTSLKHARIRATGYVSPRTVTNEKTAETARRILAHPTFARFMCWSGALFDLATPLCLLHPRLFPIALPAFIAFHAFVKWYYDVGIFPYLNIICLVLFAPIAWEQGPAMPDPAVSVAPVLFFASYFGLQLLVPMRRLYLAYVLAPGRVAIYTDHNFYFSWTMKLVNSRPIKFRMEVFDRKTGEALMTAPMGKYFNRHTCSKVASSSRALILVAKMLEPHLARDPKLAGVDFGIRASVWVSYNAREPYEIVDPLADLRAEPVRAFGTYPWQRLGGAPVAKLAPA